MENIKEKPKAILVDIIDPEMKISEANSRLDEMESLVETYGGIVIVKTIQKRALPDYKTFIGKGKVDEIADIGRENDARIVILNNIVKPRQVFNLNEIFRKKSKMEVWDRIDLILNIFDKHAQSTEAKLQIALARIRHMGPRISGLGKELMQQTGAIGLRGGAGETNIEIMKRHLRRQEQRIQEKLTHYQKIGAAQRKLRKRHNLKTAALIGYTNAGKSSVLRALTNKDVYIADELFATLDTRVGKLYIEPKIPENKSALSDKDNAHQDAPAYKYTPGTEIMISDTIGFIRDLPPDLIQAFKSTLAETIEADLILHVIDISDPLIADKIEIVENILTQLELQNKPKIYVFNKIDLIDYEGFMEADFKDIADVTEDDPDENFRKYPGLLKAGRETARRLGWIDFKISPGKEDMENLFFHNPKFLIEHFKKYSPVFISADKRLNLDDLITSIKKNV